MYFFLLQIPNPKYDDTDTENESDFVLHPWSLNKNSRKLCKQSPAAHKVSQDFISSGNSKAIHQQQDEDEDQAASQACQIQYWSRLMKKTRQWKLMKSESAWWVFRMFDNSSIKQKYNFKKRSSFNVYQKTFNKQWIEDCYCVNIKHNIKQCAGKWRLLFWTTKNELAREKK